MIVERGIIPRFGLPDISKLIRLNDTDRWKQHLQFTNWRNNPTVVQWDSDQDFGQAMAKHWSCEQQGIVVQPQQYMDTHCRVAVVGVYRPSKKGLPLNSEFHLSIWLH